MDSSEHEDAQEMTPQSSEVPQDVPTPEPVVAPVPLPHAEPGVYVCVHENAGEHAVLGRLEFALEYDYSHETNPSVMEAVAACVAGGVLEKK